MPPAPNRNARRRNIRPDWRTLPPRGWSGAVPEWPIDGAADAELALWRDLWRTPQADAWAELGWTRIVARYARLVIQSEMDDPDRKPTAEVALLGEIRQMEDRLGLTPMAMRRLQWDVGTADAAAEPEARVVNLFG